MTMMDDADGGEERWVESQVDKDGSDEIAANVETENVNRVPKLIDEKRRHLQRRLSQSQREALIAK